MMDKLSGAASGMREMLPSRNSASSPVPPPPRLDDTAPGLIKAYEAALGADALIPPCEPLRTVLKSSADSGVPLSSIDLRGTQIGKLGAKGLAAVLQVDSFITFANLEDTGLGDEGVVMVTDALRTHPTIFRLDLGYNGVGGKGIKAVAALLLESASLLCLDLSGNNLYSRKAVGLELPRTLAAS